MNPDWEARCAALWSELDKLEPADFVRRMDELTKELAPVDGIGFFERASARDSTGDPAMAVPLYRAAIGAGLEGIRRRRAVIQMASSLRALGEAMQSAELLATEMHRTSDELDDAVRAFLALALVDLGKEREAVSLALGALSRHLPRYNRSLARYAEGLRG